MIKFEDNLVGQSGDGELRTQPNILVTVTDVVTGLPAALFSDDIGTVLPQPLRTNYLGYYSFYAAEGRYELRFTGNRMPAGMNKVIDLVNEDAVSEEALAGAEHYPYVITYAPLPTTSTLTQVLPVMTVQFYLDPKIIPQTTYIAPANKIIDVWVTPAGAYVFETSNPDAYSSLPRHDNYLHVYRIYTNGTRIQGAYQRFGTVRVTKRPAAKPYNVVHLKESTIIPAAWFTWSNGGTCNKGSVYRASTGDLWMCESSGICSAEPAAPTYSETANSGFDIVPSGAATFSFRGRSGYKNVWRVNPRAGIQWYFANIAAGLMADRCPAEVKAYLQAVAFHVVDNWIAAANYSEGQKVGGTATQGRVWEALTNGVAGGASMFPPSATVGTTCVDGTVTWRCIGTFAHASQRYFWYDTDPTMREGRSPDSHDSYAATFVWAVWRYMKANPTDTAWLSVPTAHPSGNSILAMIKDIVYINLLTQINGTGLTNTFQDNNVPGGGSYAASFFMDNCEVYAGLLAAERLYALVGDAAYSASVAGFKTNLGAALENLWEPATGAYKYVAGLPSMAPPVSGKALFYPLCMSQAWGALWGVPLFTDRQTSAFTYMATHYPNWWARNDVDDVLAIGAHYGYAAYTGSTAVKTDVLARVELDRLKLGQSDLYIHDAAYYISLRDSQIVRDLSNP